MGAACPVAYEFFTGNDSFIGIKYLPIEVPFILPLRSVLGNGTAAPVDALLRDLNMTVEQTGNHLTVHSSEGESTRFWTYNQVSMTLASAEVTDSHTKLRIETPGEESTR